MLPNLQSLLQSFNNFTAYYIVVSIIGFILLALLIWAHILIRQNAIKDERLRKQLCQQCKRLQQAYNNPECSQSIVHSSLSSPSGSNQGDGDNICHVN